MESIFLVSREGGLFGIPKNRIGDIIFYGVMKNR
nr:MAG TPA: Putative RNA-binding domain in YlmH [Caudoviricetes sp.]